MNEKAHKFAIECGEHRGVVEAPTLGEAWRKLTRGKKTGFAPLARFNTERTPIWQYITPQALDGHK